MIEVINESSKRYTGNVNGGLIELKPHQLAIIQKMEDMEKSYFTFAERKTAELTSMTNAMNILQKKMSDIENNLKEERYDDEEIFKKELKELSKELDNKKNVYSKELKVLLKEGFGVLGTNVGSGKTFCIIAKILLDKKNADNGPISRSTVKGTMIVMPPHLYYQWEEALEMFVEKGFLNIMGLNNYDQITKLYEEKYRKDILNKDVYLVNANNYERVANTFNDNKISFKRVVFDEINTVSNMMDTTISSAFTWFVSASLQNEIEHNPSFEIVGYGHTGPDVLKKTINADDKFVFDSFQIPAYKYKKESVTNPVLEKLLEIEGLLDGDSVTALNACDPSTALKKLDIRLNPLSKQAKQVNDMQFTMALYNKLATVPDDIDLNLESLNSAYKNCFSDTEKETVLEQIKEQTAKKEKYQSLIEKLKEILPDEKIDEFWSMKRPKLVRLLNLLDRLRDQKVMIYSKYPKVFSSVQQECEDNGIGYSDFEDGTEEKMRDAMHSFKTDSKINILCAHSVMFSCGTNLENLTHIIFMHKVTQDVKKQVIGRGQRPGRTGPLTVIELLHKNEN